MIDRREQLIECSWRHLERPRTIEGCSEAQEFWSCLQRNGDYARHLGAVNGDATSHHCIKSILFGAPPINSPAIERY